MSYGYAGWLVRNQIDLEGPVKELVQSRGGWNLKSPERRRDLLRGRSQVSSGACSYGRFVFLRAARIRIPKFLQRT
jgi:hypothetical protein